MKSLYIECASGAAGDMLTAALYELAENKNEFIEKMNSLGIPGVTVTAEKAVRCGITGTHMKVVIDGADEHEHGHEHGHEHNHEHEHHHHHSTLGGIEAMINGFDLSPNVKKNAIAVYNRIAEAEAHVHGTTVSDIHFHEVGTKDAVADVVGVCLLIEMLGAEKIIASPVKVGFGEVHCAHGILPVPAPATAHLLSGVPIYAGDERGEFCTPTGAALLTHFASSFERMPEMKIEKIGCGMGTKEFKTANCLRAMLGEIADSREEVVELSCNIDDMTPEALAFASAAILAAGALDVYTTPVIMKKGRPGFLFTVICKEEKKTELVPLIFKHTSSIGIREQSFKRYTLERTAETVETKYGPVRVKKSHGYGVSKTKPEFEDLAKIAREENVALSEID